MIMHLHLLIPFFLLLDNYAFAFSVLPSWEVLSSKPALSKPRPPIYHDTLPQIVEESSSQQKPILYRDKDCICAASETVWLALECKNVDYLTVLVSKDDDEYVPRIIWPQEDNGINESINIVVETDPIKLLEEIQKRYPNNDPQFYPKLSMAVDASRCNIIRLPGVMPRNSNVEFMSLAPYMFKEDGTMVLKSSHCVSLEEIDEMQEEYYLGSYLCGKDVTAADMVWAPYLERYAVQLPLIFPQFKTCNPRSSKYEEVAKWYTTMEQQLVPYACRVQGDYRHWRKCLEQAVALHNERAVSDDEKVTSLPPVPKEFGWWMTRKNSKGEDLWAEYKESRPWLGDTPANEVALFLMRKHEDIVSDATTSLDMSEDDTDEALREVIQLLVDKSVDTGDLSENAKQMARFASEMIEVPRDLGMIPALALGKLVLSLQFVPA